MSDLSINHWQIDCYKQQVTRKQLQQILLHHGDTILMHGRLRELKTKHLGAGIYEISKKPITSTEQQPEG